MAFRLFKPNKSNKGALLSVNFVAKADKGDEKGDKSFYFRMVGQTSWDEKRGRGGFKDGETIVSKMSPLEVAGIVHSIGRGKTLAESMNQKYIYHDGEKTSSIISFEPLYKKVREGEKWVETDERKGFALRVTKKDGEKGNTSLAIGFTFAEAELFALFLEDGLAHVFNAWRSEDIEAYRAAKENRSSQRASEPEEPQTDNSSPEEEDPDDVTI